MLLIMTGTALASCGGDGTGNVPEAPESCTVTFDSLGADKYSPVTVGYGEYVKAPLPPEKEGYTFKGWFNGEKRWSFSYDKVTCDVTLVAKYVAKSYSISYDLRGGEVKGPLPESYTVESTGAVLPTPTRGDSIFDGWYLGDERIDEIPTGMIGDVTLVAYFYDTKPTVLPNESGEVASVRAYATEGDGVITLELIGDQAATIPLRIEIPEGWHFVSLSQGSHRSYAEVKLIDGRRYADFKVSTGGYTATLTPVTYSDDLTLESSFGKTLANGRVIDLNYYPGFVRKAVTFTIDDGDMVNDEIFLGIVKPAGIKGTFNLCNVKEGMLELYEGYEVANHHVLHTTPMRDGFDYSKVEFVDGYLPVAGEQDYGKIYLKSQTVDGKRVEGLYYVHYTLYGSTAGWHPLASDETYTEYLEWTTDEIEKTFGVGECVGFAYPHGSLSETVKEYIKNAGYLYARKTGNLKATTGFALPADRFAWTYNADVKCLLEVMASYDALEDSGELKFFAFGVHAKDFVGKWDVLEEFAQLYGGREEEFWYATNREVFEYEDAIRGLVIIDEKIENRSEVDVFITVDGIKTLIPAHGEYIFD